MAPRWGEEAKGMQTVRIRAIERSNKPFGALKYASLAKFVIMSHLSAERKAGAQLAEVLAYSFLLFVILRPSLLWLMCSTTSENQHTFWAHDNVWSVERRVRWGPSRRVNLEGTRFITPFCRTVQVSLASIGGGLSGVQSIMKTYAVQLPAPSAVLDPEKERLSRLSICQTMERERESSWRCQHAAWLENSWNLLLNHWLGSALWAGNAGVGSWPGCFTNDWFYGFWYEPRRLGAVATWLHVAYSLWL